MFKKLIEESTGKSPWLFHINAGSCNGCDIELVSVLTPRYDAERLGFKLAGSPRHADGCFSCLLFTLCFPRGVFCRLSASP